METHQVETHQWVSTLHDIAETHRWVSTPLCFGGNPPVGFHLVGLSLVGFHLDNIDGPYGIL